MYQKEIIYVALSKNGEKTGNAGFAKVENKEGRGKLFLQLKNIPHTVNGAFPIRLYDGEEWKEIDKINIKEGSGVWQTDNADFKAGIQLQIMLENGYQIYGRSRDFVEKIQQSVLYAQVETDEHSEPDTAHVKDKVLQAENTPAQTDEGRQQKFTQAESVFRAVEEERPRMKKEELTQKAEEEAPRKVALKKTQANGVKEDKWEQILDTYDKIHPYGDDRLYVKLEPKDFVVLQEKYQHLVNNSFLLHGFYNYRYVILGKEKGYYLGVPGVFYEREKMMALMFGFEAFECEGGIAKEGDFGYYLRKVEL